MEQLQENNAGQNHGASANPSASPGRTLREARERLGLSVADVANQIKFAPRQIDALESDDFQQLQGATFLRGFVRSYAKILQLDALPLLDQLPVDRPVHQQPTPASVEMPFPAMLSLRRQNLIWLAAAFMLAVIVVGFGLWHSSTPRSSSETTRAQSPEAPSKTARIEIPVSLPSEMKVISDLPVPEAGVASFVPAVPKLISAPAIVQSSVPATKTSPSQVAAQIQPAKPEIKTQKSESKTETTESRKSEIGTSAQMSTLRLVFGEESWTEIKDGDDQIISSQVNQPGTELRLDGHPPFTMLIGHALSVHLYDDDEEIDLKPYINKYSEVAHLTLE